MPEHPIRKPVATMADLCVALMLTTDCVALTLAMVWASRLHSLFPGGTWNPFRPTWDAWSQKEERMPRRSNSQPHRFEQNHALPALLGRLAPAHVPVVLGLERG